MKSPQPSPSARRSRRPERFRLRPLSLSVPRKELHRELTRLAAAREIPGSRGPGAGGCIYTSIGQNSAESRQFGL
jgi:hypothetical protein